MFLAKPQTGHIYQALHIFKYLEVHIKNELSFDPLYQFHPYVRDLDQVVDEMKEVDVDAIKDLQHKAPKPRGKGVQINCFVDADHGRDKVIRCS